MRLLDDDHVPDGQPVRGRKILAGFAILLIGAAALWWWNAREATPPGLPSTTAAPREAPREAAREVAPSPTPGPMTRPEPSPRAGTVRRGTKAARPEAVTPAPEPAADAELRIEADVEGASVFVDRKYLGTTPLVTRDIAAGTHQLNVSAEGEDGVARTIEVAPSGPTTVSVRLREVRLDASVSVVHKHGMGSCDGQLVATPAGLRYQASNTKDAFALPFASLEVFKVDYLEKHLQVKQRGGRTWNFTTKNDSADPLFVFHRDVEKARARLTAP